MPYVPKDTLDTMLKTLPYDQRRTLVDVINGRVGKVVKCLSKDCNGRTIAYIYQDAPDKQRVVPSNEDTNAMYLYQSRPRLDGQWGFHCKCGNNSLLSEHEQGIIGSNVPTKSDLDTIWANIQSKQPNYPVNKGKQIVDGFSIEEIS